MLLQSLLRLITSKRNMSESFLNKIKNSNLSSDIKRKAEMYYKKDQRLSLSKFVQDINRFKTVKNNSKKGGTNQVNVGIGKMPVGMRFALNNGAYQAFVGKLHIQAPTNFNFSPSRQSPGQSSTTIDSPRILYSPVKRRGSANTRLNCPVNNNSSNQITADKKKLGQGSFGVVYEMEDGKAWKVIMNKDLKEDIQNCLVEFAIASQASQSYQARANKAKNTLINVNNDCALYDLGPNFKKSTTFGEQLKLFKVVKPEIEIEVDNDSVLAYEMDVCSGTALEYMKINISDVSFVDRCASLIEKLRGINCIHGDIKLENILYKTSSSSSMSLPLLHDLDTIFVYNSSGLHLKEHPYNRPLLCTPICAHPLFLLYTQAVKQSKNEIELLSYIATNITKHIDLWKLSILSVKNDESVKHFIRMVLCMLDNIYVDSSLTNTKPDGSRYVSSFTELKNSKKIDDVIRDHLQNFDKYALGMSILFHVKNGSFKENVENLKEKAIELIYYSIKFNNNVNVSVSNRGGNSTLINTKRADQKLTFQPTEMATKYTTNEIKAELLEENTRTKLLNIINSVEITPSSLDECNQTILLNFTAGDKLISEEQKDIKDFADT